MTILGNLIDNAVDAAQGGVRPRVTVTARTEEDGSELVLRVGDTGPGVDPDRAEELFRLGYSTKPSGPGGRGLGLALVRQAVSRHGGTLAVTSGEDGGAVFDVRVPLRETAGAVVNGADGADGAAANGANGVDGAGGAGSAGANGVDGADGADGAGGAGGAAANGVDGAGGAGANGAGGPAANGVDGAGGAGGPAANGADGADGAGAAVNGVGGPAVNGVGGPAVNGVGGAR